MLIYDQVAMRTTSIDAQIEIYKQLGHPEWLRDTVDAVHIYKSTLADDLYRTLGESFKVGLAFNYSIIPGVEFELLEMLGGSTYQTVMPGRMSHFGYHTKTDQAESGQDSLLLECLQWQHGYGARVIQISQTVLHKGTGRRYRYAYVQGGLTGDIPVKIIQRLLPLKVSEIEASLKQGRELFACLA